MQPSVNLPRLYSPKNNSTLEKALLSKNAFEAIAFENLSALKVINLRTNKLTKAELKGLSSLEELELSYNQLHSREPERMSEP